MGIHGETTIRMTNTIKLLFAVCLCWAIATITTTTTTTTTTALSISSIYGPLRNRLGNANFSGNGNPSSFYSATTTTLFVATVMDTKTVAPPAKHKPPKRQPPKTSTLSKNQEALAKRTFPRTWVPLASVNELDPDRPTPLEFLDQNFVCYKQTPEDNYDVEDDWIVMDDVCPHRLTRLSEGRINRSNDDVTATTTIQCSYHGWEFDGTNDGACVSIPQASPEVSAIALANSRSSATTYSVRVHKNILWFWPWADVDALSLLPDYPKGHPEGIMGSIANTNDGSESNPTSYTRDLPYGWDTLLENLIDPAHIPFAHHNLQGKREDAIPITMTFPESLGEFEYKQNQGDVNVGIDGEHGHNNNSNSNNNNSKSKSKRLGEVGFFFEWQDRTMGKHRGGMAEFQAPFGIAYDGLFYATREEADAARGSHSAHKRQALTASHSKNEAVTIPVPANVNSVDDHADAETKDKKDLGSFKLGVLCIPTKAGWSRAIILTGGQAKETKAKARWNAKKAKANANTKLQHASAAHAAIEELKSNSNSKSDTQTKKTKPEKKKIKSLLGKIFGIIPPWVIHLLSNKFLDSDLAFLHYQEQERLRHESDAKSSGSGYYMPAQADRCITTLRQWLPKHTDYLGSSSNINSRGMLSDGHEDGHVYTLPPPIMDRNQLFNRWQQHTSHCKHCQNGLKFVTKTARNTACGGLVASVVASHFLRSRRVLSLLAKLVALACLGALRLLASLEPVFKVGEFKHYENH